MGSSRRSTSGCEASTCASRTRSLKPPESTRIGSWWHSGRDAEPLEDLAGLGLERVAVVREDVLLDLGVAVGVELLVVGVREDLLALGDRLPDVVAAHHRDFEDRRLLVLEVVLLQDAEPGPLRDVDRAVRGDLLAREDAEKGRLAGAVRPDQSIARAGVQLHGDPFEEGISAPGFSKVGDRNHATEEDIRPHPLDGGGPRRGTLERAEMRRSRLGLLVLLCAGSSAGAVRADDVHLHNGKTFEGVIVAERGETLDLQFPGGTISIPRSSVREIVSSDSPYTEYLSRAAELRRARADAARWVELARWASGLEMDTAAREAVLEAAAIDPMLAERRAGDARLRLRARRSDPTMAPIRRGDAQPRPDTRRRELAEP